jgi:ATP-dependent DNA ligase
VELVVSPPILPMLAKRIEALPVGTNLIYEPKWDGFRAIVFRDGDEVLIQSRDEKPLNRYFPELLEPLRRGLPTRYVADGEIVIAKNGALDFDELQLRLHPAASRVKLLAEKSPAAVMFFDLLCEGDRDLRKEPFRARRERLQNMLSAVKAPIHLTPATIDRTVAADWFKRFEGAGLDGVMAKSIDGAYEPNKRTMFKVKHERDCDCVVAGFRWHKKVESGVGSLLLGLFNSEEKLQHVGVCSSFSAETRRELAEFLEPYRKNARNDHPWKEWAAVDAGQRIPGAQSRWSSGKDLSWEPVRVELVAEVAYDHMQRDRFRHIAQFRRWRFDKSPRDCTYAQLEVVPPHELAQIFGLAG